MSSPLVSDQREDELVRDLVPPSLLPENSLVAQKHKSLARINKIRMECSGSNNPAGILNCLAVEMATPTKAIILHSVASLL